jgi:GntR family transcriptional regulator/MocR family aminotransferase
MPGAGAPVELALHLDRAEPRPLAVQLADQLRAASTDGRLRRGDRLPSTRALAALLGVSRTVTAAAMDVLVAEGWVRARPGSGTYVAAVSRQPAAAGPAGVGGPAGVRGPAGADGRRVPGGRADPIDLRPGAPWVGGIDPAAWRRAWRAAAARHPPPRARPAGLPAFRAAVAEHLVRHRGLPADTGDVLATAGTTTALAELVTALLAAGALRRGDLVAVEEPGYQRGIGALRSAGRAVGLRVVPAPVDDDGLVVDALPAGTRMVMCTPAHQYPLGGRLPAARRVALVALARRAGILLLEDDYDGELRHAVPPLPVLAALDPSVVVHLGTASKMLTPVLGAGWMVAPRWVGAAVLAHRERAGVIPPEAGQGVFAELAAHGDLARHLRRLRAELAVRRGLLLTALAGVPGGDRLCGADAGAHVVLPLPDAVAERRVLRRAARSGVLLDGLGRHHGAVADDPAAGDVRAGDPADRRHGVVIGYAGPARERLAAGLVALARAGGTDECDGSVPG